MVELTTEDILRDNKAHHPNSITSISLTHKALTYAVSCLIDFNNLERLNLSFNTLTSLKGLESCFNLKWLSVQQNNLHNLKGIEALTNLAVLNAGKNKLKSMDEVKNLVKLRALILNDNEIASISGLDQLTELNTLVLSRNPICKVGNSLAKLKSIVKISLSYCQLEDIDNSFKACIGLEQLRLAHNDIKTLPEGLAYSKKLQILDLGNNMISRWPDLEVLSSLCNLKNLNLLGNPIAEKVKLVKKVKKLVPGLQILNSKRMDKLSSKKDQNVDGAVISVGDEKGLNNDLKLTKDRGLDDGACSMGKVRSSGNLKVVERNGKVITKKECQLSEKRDHMKKEKSSGKAKTGQITERDPDVAKIDSKNVQKKKEKHVGEEVLVQEADKTIKDKRSKRKAAHLDVIDDKETSFAELVAHAATESINPSEGQRRGSQGVGSYDKISALVTYPVKKKKSKNQGGGASVLQNLTPEFGLGGPSAWTDEE